MSHVAIPPRRTSSAAHHEPEREPVSFRFCRAIEALSKGNEKADRKPWNRNAWPREFLLDEGSAMDERRGTCAAEAAPPSIEERCGREEAVLVLVLRRNRIVDGKRRRRRARKSGHLRPKS